MYDVNYVPGSCWVSAHFEFTENVKDWNVDSKLGRQEELVFYLKMYLKKKNLSYSKVWVSGSHWKTRNTNFIQGETLGKTDTILVTLSSVKLLINANT